MKIDANLSPDIGTTTSAAAAVERDGYDGLWVWEASHDPFLQCLDAVRATRTVSVGTSIAIAFARNPMTLANLGYDLARYGEGRFVLGLGSQIKPHIERRYSMPWSKPAARMRELVLAMRAIWACWQDGAPLDFRGEFYTHTLMTPLFTPHAHAFGPPPVYLAGVGPRMTEVAGEVGDGFFVHPFTTLRYLTEITMPALLRGRAKAGKTDLDDFTVCYPPMVTVGRDEVELAAATDGIRKQLAFYGSTPAYRPVLDLHGWGDLQPELKALSKQGRWDDMASLIDDEMVRTFSVVGPPEDVGKNLASRLGGVVDRATLYTPYAVDPAVRLTLLDAIR